MEGNSRAAIVGRALECPSFGGLWGPAAWWYRLVWCASSICLSSCSQDLLSLEYNEFLWLFSQSYFFFF